MFHTAFTVAAELAHYGHEVLYAPEGEFLFVSFASSLCGLCVKDLIQNTKNTEIFTKNTEVLFGHC